MDLVPIHTCLKTEKNSAIHFSEPLHHNTMNSMKNIDFRPWGKQQYGFL